MVMAMMTTIVLVIIVKETKTKTDTWKRWRGSPLQAQLFRRKLILKLI
jgi:hypothetical protein